MLRVPGSSKDLFQVKSEGGDVRVVYSPLDAVKLAKEMPDRQVVFFGIGFETTAPANAMAVHVAKKQGLTNFSMLVSHVLVPPAIAAIMTSPKNRVQAFLAAGHVLRWNAQHPALVERFHVPIVVTGFEPLDILEGIAAPSGNWKRVRPGSRTYERVVTMEGTFGRRCWPRCSRWRIAWRGIGTIPPAAGGCPRHREFDAALRFDVSGIHTQESPLCHSGEVLQGALKPNQCPAFGKECTPRTPLGATMVSSEGACAAYYHYGRFRDAEPVTVA
jgi:hydrogenase expression/formation protein HypD